MARKYNEEEIIKGVIGFLKDTNHENSLGEVVSTLSSIAGVDKEGKVASIFTPVSLSDDYKNQIREKLEQLAGHEIVVRERIDKSLLGGFKIKLGDWVYDASLKGQLEALKNELYGNI